MLDIRQAISSDLEAVTRITAQAYSIWVPILGYSPQPVTDDPAPRIEQGEVFVACYDKAVVGVIAVERGDDHDLIFNVAVDPGHAGKGIGRRLIQEIEQQARSAGKASMTLYTNALMERNISLYIALGYVETGRRPNTARPGFTIVDMKKDLQTNPSRLPPSRS